MAGQDIHQQYSMVLQWDPRDEIYVVSVPELPGCHTHGSTREEAVRQGQDAIESWLDVADELDRPLPAPRIWKD
jgi:predicted RNase H-like HicB family nuclease